MEMESRLEQLEAQLEWLNHTVLDQKLKSEEFRGAQDAAWTIVNGALLALMQVGFAMLESGSVRETNVIVMHAKNVLDLAVGTMVAALWGYYVAYGIGPSSFQGMSDEMLLENAKNHRDFWGASWHGFFFHCLYQANSATIVSGAMAERTGLRAYALLCILNCGCLYSLCVRFAWTEHGFLAAHGFIDFAGSGVVHMLGGVVALVGSIVVGPRTNRWDAAYENDFVPSNVPKVLEGALFLWVGWYGFNTGSTGAMSTISDARRAYNAAVTTTCSAFCGGMAAGAIEYVRCNGQSLDILAVANGILSGLVAINAGADTLPVYISFVVGLVAGAVYVGVARLLLWLRIDDVVNATAVHGGSGLWGLLALGLFEPKRGLFPSGDAALLGAQALGALTIGAIAAVPMLAATLLLQRVGLLRVSAEDESKGGDQAVFGMRAYVRHSAVLRRHRALEKTLDEHGHTLEGLLEALVSLRLIIFRTLTPQAGDHKIEGEVRCTRRHTWRPPPGARHPSHATRRKPPDACDPVHAGARRDGAPDIRLGQHRLVHPPRLPLASQGRRRRGRAHLPRQGECSL